MHIDDAFQWNSELILRTEKLGNFFENLSVGACSIVKTRRINDCHLVSSHTDPDDLASVRL